MVLKQVLETGNIIQPDNIKLLIAQKIELREVIISENIILFLSSFKKKQKC